MLEDSHDLTDLFADLSVDAVAQRIVARVVAGTPVAAAAVYHRVGRQWWLLAHAPGDGDPRAIAVDRDSTFHAALDAIQAGEQAHPVPEGDVAPGWGLPLAWQGRVLAVLVAWLDVELDDPSLHAARHIVPEWFQQQAALAFHHALVQQRLEARLNERTIELSTIEVLSQQMVTAFDLHTVARDLVAAAMSAMDVALGSCALVRDTAGLTWIAHLDTSTVVPADAPAPARPPVQSDAIQHVLRSGRAMLIADSTREPDDLTVQPGMRSELCVPIIRHDRIIGILDFEDTRPGYFTPDHERFVNTLAKHAAIAIENARLYREARATRDQLQAILDSTQDAMLMLDRRGRLLQANVAALAVLGESLRAQVGRSLWQWLHRMDDALLVNLLGYTSAELRRYILEVMRHPAESTHRRFRQEVEATTRYLDERGTPVYDADGAVAGWLMVWRDVTEQHRLDHLRNELSNMIVHDLRNPVNSMMSSLSLLDELIADAQIDPALQQDVIRVARSSGETMLGLIESLLDVARLEQNSIDLHYDALPLVSLVHRVEETIFPAIMASELAVTYDLPDDLPLVWGDAEKLQRVLANLFDNALRHTPGGGQIHIAAWSLDEGRAVQVTVEDSGVGIPNQDRERIFDKFTQLDHSVVRGHKGSGLGLTFCKLAIETHGGHIWIEDSRLGGAAFCFTVPTASSTEL